MKKYLIIVFITFSAMQGHSQSQKFSVEVGYVYVSTDMADENRKITQSWINQYNPHGISLKVTAATKWKFLDLCAGGIKLFKTGDSHDWFNGGGVYAGISPKLKTKYVGLTSDLALAVFSARRFKENVFEDTGYYLSDQSGAGLGAYMAVGFYVKYKRISINPSFCCFFNGGDPSYMLSGINIPLVYHF